MKNRYRIEWADGYVEPVDFPSKEAAREAADALVMELGPGECGDFRIVPA